MVPSLQHEMFAQVDILVIFVSESCCGLASSVKAGWVEAVNSFCTSSLVIVGVVENMSADVVCDIMMIVS